MYPTVTHTPDRVAMDIAGCQAGSSHQRCAGWGLAGEPDAIVEHHRLERLGEFACGDVRLPEPRDRLGGFRGELRHVGTEHLAAFHQRAAADQHPVDAGPSSQNTRLSIGWFSGT